MLEEEREYLYKQIELLEEVISEQYQENENLRYRLKKQIEFGRNEIVRLRKILLNSEQK